MNMEKRQTPELLIPITRDAIEALSPACEHGQGTGGIPHPGIWSHGDGAADGLPVCWSVHGRRVLITVITSSKTMYRLPLVNSSALE
jgi:hypothetical protein